MNLQGVGHRVQHLCSRQNHASCDLFLNCSLWATFVYIIMLSAVIHFLFNLSHVCCKQALLQASNVVLFFVKNRFIVVQSYVY